MDENERLALFYALRAWQGILAKRGLVRASDRFFHHNAIAGAK